MPDRNSSLWDVWIAEWLLSVVPISVKLLPCSFITSALKMFSILLHILQSTILNENDMFIKITYRK